MARLVFKAKTRTLDIRINYKGKYKNGLHSPFCSEYDETFEHILKCNAGLRVPKQLKDFTLQSFSMAPSCRKASQKVKLSEGEHYNFQLNKCCYECVTVQLLFLLFFYSYQFFNNLILLDIMIM